MPLFVTGISHHTAPLEVRERLAITPGAYADKVDELLDAVGVREAVILSTCNRTELYGVGSVDRYDRLRDWLLSQGGIDPSAADGLVYRHEGREAVRHLFRVACGLDSMVLGEPQIMGQLKDAWQAARDAGGLGKYTDRLFQRAFAVSKDVRTNTGINDHPVSVAYIAAILARQIFGDLTQKNVQLVGAGEMITLCGNHFRQKAVGSLRIANRSRDRAESLAAELQAEAMGLDDLERRLAEADVVIACTGATTPVVRLEMAEQALRQRRRKPMFMVDLGVPRDIDPRVGKLRDVYLYTIDDLRKVADESLGKREEAAREALGTIDHEVREYLRWVHGVRAAAGLRRLRDHAEENARELAERALHQIQAGGDPEAIVHKLGSTLTHRILHGPSIRLRRAAEEQHDDILRAADWLFEPEAFSGDDSDVDSLDGSSEETHTDIAGQPGESATGSRDGGNDAEEDELAARRRSAAADGSGT
jgi:glutamyl-tRNA reductase